VTRPASDSLVSALMRHCAARPAQAAVTYLDGSGVPRDTMTYQELLAGARRAAEILRARGAAGERVLILARPERAFLEWYFGCLLAGAIAVPAPPVTGRHRLERLQLMAADAAAALLVGRVTAGHRERLPGIELLAPDAHATAAGADSRPPAPDAVAMLQYTSGSTTQPRGVVLTHQQLLHNIAQIAAAFGLSPDDRALIWLPPHHDMGLIGGLLAPVLTGFPTMVLDAADFARQPLTWLQAISAHRATVSGGPNTGYELTAREIEGQAGDPPALDLSSWAVAFVGAEPVQEATLRRFAAAAGRHGFRERALRPCYGLAEATLLVTCTAPGQAGGGGRTGTGDSAADNDGQATAGSRREAVSAGQPVAGTLVRVVTPAGRPCPPGTVGEVWVSGPGVAAGYWNRARESGQVFHARIPGERDHYLRTGDLGMLDEAGALIPTGRQKDLLIINGRNVYPSDLEFAAVRAAEPQRPGLAAAFRLDDDAQIAVVLECGSLTEPVDAILRRVQAAVTAEAEHPVTVVAVARAATLPRTTSGKIQRSRARERFLAGDIVVLGSLDSRVTRGSWLSRATALRAGLSGAGARESGAGRRGARAGGGSARSDAVGGYLRDRLAALGFAPPPGAGAAAESPSALGIDSLTVLSVLEELDVIAGAPLPRGRLMAAATVAQMAEVVVAGWVAAPGSDGRPAADLPADGLPADGLRADGLPAADLRADGLPPAGHWHPAVPAEAAMFLLEAAIPGGTNIAAACELDGRPAPGAIDRAVAALVGRHEVLRTCYRAAESGVTRRVDRQPPPCPVAAEDGADWPPERVSEWLTQAAARPFDLGAAPLIRVQVLARRERRCLLVVAVPHIVADFRTMTILFSDLAAAVGGAPLAAPPAPYRAHVARARAFESSPAAAAARAHFTTALRDAGHRLELPGRCPGGGAAGGAAAEIAAELDSPTAARAAALAREESATTFAVLLALYQALLHHHTGQQALVVGVPVLGRDDPRFAGTAGLFMNQLPVVSRPGAGATLRDLIQQARAQVRAVMEHQNCPLASIAAGPGAAPGGEGVFDTLFVVHRAGRDQPGELAAFEVADGAAVNVSGFRWCSVRVPRIVDTLPLTVTGAEHAGGFRFIFRFRVGSYPADRVRLLADSFPVLAGRLLADPDRAFLRADPLPSSGWAPTRPLPRPGQAAERPAAGGARAAEREAPNLIARLREVARQHPERQSVQDPAGELSYRELWELTQRGAGALARRGVRPGDLVALLHERDHLALAMSYAALAAGAGYIHLDSGSPSDRLRRLAAESRPRIVICDDGHAGRARELGPPVVSSRSLAAGSTQAWRTAARPEIVPPSAVAYVSYTSGSSGSPKGVAVSHRAALAGAGAYAREIALRPGDIMCGVSSLSWDITVGELIAAPVSGATVCFAPDAITVDGAALGAYLDTCRAGVMATTPHRWRLLLDAGWRPPPGFRAVCGGDVMPAEDGARFRGLSMRTWNFYGPTETVLWASRLDLRDWPGAGPVPIGRPLAGYRADVTNPADGPAVPGVPGELCIGGSAIADGYLGDPRLTAERFGPDPLGPAPGARRYRSGDIARWDDGGHLRYLGRLDSQVKMRGYRIETGDVEAALTAVPGVAAAVAAVAGEGPDAELAAFVVPAPGARLQPGEVLEAVAGALPRYMVPSRLVTVTELPVTRNGKVDRGVLAAPRPSVARPAMAPRTGTERLVAQAMEEVLQAGQVSLDDHFFLLGGHSLRAVQVVARIRERSGRPVPMSAIFEHPTVRALARAVDALLPVGPLAPAGAGTALFAPAADDRPAGPPGAVTSGQRRLWADHVAGRGDLGMILPFVVELTGPVQPDAVRAAFDTLVDRHDSLRTEVVTVRGEPRQRLGPRPRLVITDLAGAGRGPEDARQEAGRRLTAALGWPWPIDRGPLLRAELLVTGPGHALLLIAVHHIIFDGWSAGVLVTEFGQAYGRLRRGQPADLPPLALSAHQAAQALESAEPRGDEQAVAAVVRQVAQASRPRLPGPEPGPGPAAHGPAAGTSGPAPGTGEPTRATAPGDPRVNAPARVAARKCTADLGGAAHAAARRLGVTPYAVATAALLAALRSRCGQDDLVVGIDLAGRDRPELEALVGYFGNQLPVAVDLRGVHSADEAVSRTARALADAVGHAAAGYDRVVSGLRRAGALPPGTDVFNVKVVHQLAARSARTAGDVSLQLADAGWASPAYPLALWVWQEPDGVGLELHHRVEACPAAWADDLLACVAAVVRAAAAGNSDELDDLMPELPQQPAPAFPAFGDIALEPLAAASGEPRTSLLTAGDTEVALVEAGDEPLTGWLASHPGRWRGYLAEHGAVLLRGFGVRTPADLHRATQAVFAERYATTEHPRQVLGDSVVTPVDYPSELELFWHNEDSFNRQWPATIAFACARPADAGGETTIVDGAAVLAALDGPEWDRFGDEGVCYVRRFIPGLGLGWQAVFGTGDRGEVLRRCDRDGIEADWDGEVLTTRARRDAIIGDRRGRRAWFAQILHWHPSCLDPGARRRLVAEFGTELPRNCTYGDGSPIADDTVTALIEVSRKREFAVSWQPGDLALLDNARVAHGRRAYRGERSIMVALGDPASWPDPAR
jgi:amino acid adenylation domain-containing protein